MEVPLALKKITEVLAVWIGTGGVSRTGNSVKFEGALNIYVLAAGLVLG